MPIKQVKQISNKDSKVWFTDITLAVDSTNKMQLNIGGQALVPKDGAQVTHNLSFQLLFEALQEGISNHVVVITRNGKIIKDPEPHQTDIAGQVCWFDLSAGETDLSNVEINQLIHIEQGT